MSLPKRKPNRLKDYDYSQNGAYFVTICTEERKCILSTIVGGGVLDAPQFILSKYGMVIKEQIDTMNSIYNHILAEKYVIMPNHIHLILFVNGSNGTSRTPSPTNGAVSQWVSTFKRYCNRKCGTPLFQRSFHDHVIRNDTDYRKIWNYIDTNPLKWETDCFYAAQSPDSP